MKIAGCEVNVRAIAEGIYDMFSVEEVACCAFGMLPHAKIELLERTLTDKAEEIAKDTFERAFGSRPDSNVASEEFRTKFVREASHQICVAIYGVASDRGQMVV